MEYELEYRKPVMRRGLIKGCDDDSSLWGFVSQRLHHSKLTFRIRAGGV